MKYEAEHSPYDETGALIYLSTALYDHQHDLRQLNIKLINWSKKNIAETSS